MYNRAVLSAGTQHYLEYALCFFERIVDDAEAEGLDVVLSSGTPDDIDEKIKEKDPAYFYGCGHGSPYRWTVECMEDYLPDNRMDFFCKDRIIHLLSCMTAVKLGHDIIDHGAKAYIGYADYFTIGVCDYTPPPCAEPDDVCDVYSCIDSDAEGARKIIFEGASAGEAKDAIAKKFEEYIHKYTEGEWKDRKVAPEMVTALHSNLEALRLYGDPDAKAFILYDMAVSDIQIIREGEVVDVVKETDITTIRVTISNGGIRTIKGRVLVYDIWQTELMIIYDDYIELKVGETKTIDIERKFLGMIGYHKIRVEIVDIYPSDEFPENNIMEKSFKVDHVPLSCILYRIRNKVIRMRSEDNPFPRLRCLITKSKLK